MNDIDCTLLSLTCKCKLCLILPTDGVEKELFAKSMAINQEHKFCALSALIKLSDSTQQLHGAVAYPCLWQSSLFEDVSSYSWPKWVMEKE